MCVIATQTNKRAIFWYDPKVPSPSQFLSVDGAVDLKEATLLNAAKTGFRLNGHPETETALRMRYLFVYTKTYAVCLENLTSQNDREVARRTTANITCSSLNPRSATCFGGSKTSKECPEAKSSNVRSFGSLVAGALTNREGKCPKDALFHRTDAGAFR
jgi:hypothetical protein